MLERRRHKRHPAPRGTFIIFRKALSRLRNHRLMSVAEIAMVLYKSELTMIRQVKDISLGGISFNGNGTCTPSGKALELDVLMTQQGIYLHNVPYAAVPIDCTADGRKTPGYRKDAFRFNDLEAGMRNQIENWLAPHLGAPDGWAPGLETAHESELGNDAHD
jgi:hypothetical protein